MGAENSVVFPTDANQVQLSSLISQEAEMLELAKEKHDLYHPKHQKILSRLELRQIARAKVMDVLCAPWDGADGRYIHDLEEVTAQSHSADATFGTIGIQVVF